MANLAVPIPRTFTVGEFETAAYLNSNVRDTANFLLNPPIAQLAQATAQSIANGTISAITFDSTVQDSYGGHSNTTNNTRYTAQIAGWYYVSGVVGYSANATGVRVARLSRNGSAVLYYDVWVQAATSSQPTGLATAGILFLNAGDYVELDAYQSSGGALSTILTGPQSGMSVYWLHT